MRLMFWSSLVLFTWVFSLLSVCFSFLPLLPPSMRRLNHLRNILCAFLCPNMFLGIDFVHSIIIDTLKTYKSVFKVICGNKASCNWFVKYLETCSCELNVWSLLSNKLIQGKLFKKCILLNFIWNKELSYQFKKQTF